MAGYPTVEQFAELGKAGDRYVSNFMDAWWKIYAPGNQKLEPREISEMAERANAIAVSSFEASISEPGARAFDWLIEQPAFVLASQAVGFRPLAEGEQLINFERVITRCVERDYSRNLVPTLLRRRSGKFLDYLSGISASAASFISGRSAKTALEGDPTFDRMQSLTSEIQQALKADWVCEGARRSLSVHLDRLSSSIERWRPSAPISKRNDADLPARLMASELIRLHHALFSATHKRAIYHLMGLPFIERPLEIRTIERLAKAEKER